MENVPPHHELDLGFSKTEDTPTGKNCHQTNPNFTYPKISPRAAQNRPCFRYLKGDQAEKDGTEVEFCDTQNEIQIEIINTGGSRT